MLRPGYATAAGVERPCGGGSAWGTNSRHRSATNKTAAAVLLLAGDKVHGGFWQARAASQGPAGAEGFQYAPSAPVEGGSRSHCSALEDGPAMVPKGAAPKPLTIAGRWPCCSPLQQRDICRNALLL